MNMCPIWAKLVNKIVLHENSVLCVQWEAFKTKYIEQSEQYIPFKTNIEQ